MRRLSLLLTAIASVFLTTLFIGLAQAANGPRTVTHTVHVPSGTVTRTVEVPGPTITAPPNDACRKYVATLDKMFSLYQTFAHAYGQLPDVMNDLFTAVATNNAQAIQDLTPRLKPMDEDSVASIEDIIVLSSQATIERQSCNIK